jgi:hypothetical protein
VEDPCEHDNEPWASIKGRFLTNRRSVSFLIRAVLHVIISRMGETGQRYESGGDLLGKSLLEDEN